MQPSLRLALPYVARTTLPTTGASTATSNNPPIFISDGASASITPSKSTRVCSVCTKNAQRYTCSRCRISYCSSDCYRTHSTTCTESFYRDQVVSALKSAPAVQADARKSMAGVLLRTREARDATAVAGTDTSDLADQMDNLSLESLPPERRTDFMRALVDGRLSALEEVWTPWWEPKRLIAEMPVAAGRDESIEPTVDDTVDEDDQDLDDEHADFVDPIYSRAPRLSPPSGGLSFPIDRDLSIEQLSQVPLPVDLPSLSTLLSKPPSPCVAFSVIDALFSYVFVARLRNGEWLDDLQSALQMVLGLSSVLKTNVIHMSVPEALEKVIASSLLPPLCAAPEFALTSARDVAQVLFFKGSVIRALCDLHRMFETLLLALKAEMPVAADPDAAALKAEKQLLIGAARKVHFLAVWSNEQSEAALQDLATQVSQEWKRRLKSLAHHTGLEDDLRSVQDLARLS